MNHSFLYWACNDCENLHCVFIVVAGSGHQLFGVMWFKIRHVNQFVDITRRSRNWILNNNGKKTHIYIHTQSNQLLKAAATRATDETQTTTLSSSLLSTSSSSSTRCDQTTSWYWLGVFFFWNHNLLKAWNRIIINFCNTLEIKN